MKSITFRGFSIITVILILLGISTRGNPLQILSNSEIDSAKNFVSFTIDDANTKANRNEKLHFYYLDSLAHGQLTSIATTGTKLIINAPTLFFEANGKQTPFLIYPGEKINIRYAGSDSTQMYIKGNSKRTNELNLFRQIVKKTGNIYYFMPTMPYQRKVNNLEDIKKLEKTIDDLKNSRLQFLSSFTKQFVVSDFINKTAFKCIESTALLDSVLLYYNNRVLLTNRNEYLKLIANKISTIKNIGFVPYPMYYLACIDLVSIATGISPYGNISNNRIEFAKRFDFIKKNFEGETKDFLLANNLNWARTNKISIAKKDFDEFNKQCKSVGYREIIVKKFNENKESYTKGGDKLLFGDGKTVQALGTVVSKYKGKIVLLDFWASWCNPCREEMPYTYKLKKEFLGKNIVFAAISTDSDISAWQKASKEESLENANSFLLLNADRATFAKKYHINSIPRYLLLGKDGKIISDDAPRPSDPKLKIMINKYLSSNLQ